MLVVGGGASAVQFIGELAPVTDTLWVTRRPPVWRDDDFDSAAGLAAVTAVEERVRQGCRGERRQRDRPGRRPQEQEAARLGAYERRLPMFERIEPDGVRWADGRFERVDVILGSPASPRRRAPRAPRPALPAGRHRPRARAGQRVQGV